MLAYRREVDGLRALAVVPVILFHAGFVPFSGGFVGVDIFFVISGYLITSLIQGELSQGRFSIVTFYERRARRILPALFAVMVACLLPAWLWMFPEAFFRFSKSLVAVSAYASNLLFLEETGYFESAAELKPLLHTWSLAVEEQFYLIFPLLLVFIRRVLPQRTELALGLIAIASLILSHLYLTYQPMVNSGAAFFLLPARAFELIIGALVALGQQRRQSQQVNKVWIGSRVKDISSIAGVALIGYSILSFSVNTPFPGFYALIPTIGTALILAFGDSNTLVGRILMSRLLVGIGLISYSAYLWHQPLLAFARIRSIKSPSFSLLLALIAATFVLAYLSWRFVEKPFRQRNRFSRKVVFIFSMMMTAILIAIGLTGYYRHGFDERLLADGEKMTTLATRFRFNFGLSQDCSTQFSLSPNCRTSDKPEILVWGDSYAMQLLPGILASRPDAKVIQLTMGGCAPNIGVFVLPNQLIAEKGFAKRCMEFNNSVLDWLKRQNSVKYVVVDMPYRNITGKNDEQMLMSDGSLSDDKAILRGMFVKTLDSIAATGSKPVVFGPAPAAEYDIGSCLAKSKLFNVDVSACDFPKSNAYEGGVVEFLSEIGKKYRVIDLKDGICPDEVCFASIGGTFLYGVGAHLSYEGSALIGAKMNFFDLITVD